jgi:hypothetical protein
MDAAKITTILDQHGEQLRRIGVPRLGWFGSTARNQVADGRVMSFPAAGVM